MKKDVKRIELSGKQISLPQFITLGYLDYSVAQPPLDEHRHKNSIEICFLSKGRQSYKVKESIYNLVGNDLFITLPEEVHSTGTLPEEKSILYWLQIDFSSKYKRLFSLSESETKKLKEIILNLPKRHFKGSKTSKDILDSILEAYASSDYPFRITYIKNKLVEFLLHLISASKKTKDKGISGSILKLQNYIKSNLDENLDINILAKEIGLSMSRLKTRFKNEVGIPPKEYVLRCKIEKSKELLKREDLNITDVAFRLDFSTSQYFATVFKRYVGKSPRAYKSG